MTTSTSISMPDNEVIDKLLPAFNGQKQNKRCPKVFPGPPQVKYIIYNELCERFSYYGVRTILIKFLENELAFAKNDAAAITLFFSALCYSSPLVGGFVADSYLGKYYTILLFSIIYVSGGGLLALSAKLDYPMYSFIGLGLIGIGTGGIKPCVSAFGADQFPKGASNKNRNREMESYFMAFYFSINFGSMGSFFFIPIVRANYGYFWAFLIPAISLFVSVLIFVAATRKYVMIPPGGSILNIIFGVCCEACRKSRSRLATDLDDCAEVLIQDSGTDLIEDVIYKSKLPPGVPWAEVKKSTIATGWKKGAYNKKVRFLDRAIGKYSRKTVEDVRAVWELVPIFLCFPIFWALYDQQTNTWEQQAELMDTWKFKPDQMGLLNSVLILMLIPLFDKIVYPFWAKCHPSVTALHKMVLGMLFTIASYISSAFVQLRVEKYQGKVSVFLQVPQYILISIGEILVSITGLEFAYTQAPTSMKAFISSFNLSMVAIGDICAGTIYTAVNWMSRPDMFFLFAFLMGVNVLIFIFFARRYHFKVFSVDKYRKSTSIMLEESKKRGLSVSYAFAGRGSSAADKHVHASIYDVPDSLGGETNHTNMTRFSQDKILKSVSIATEKDVIVEGVREPI